MVSAFDTIKMYNFIMPLFRFRCTCDDSIHELHLAINDYKKEMPCPCKKGVMVRIFDSFNSKNGRTLSQKKLGASEKRIDSGEWMKEETRNRKAKAPPATREGDSNEFWLGNEFKNGDKNLKDF